MHPGNILVREVDRSGGIAERFALLLKQLSWGLPFPGVREVFRNVVLPPQPQLVLLDTGMIAELSKTDQHSVVQFFRVRICPMFCTTVHRVPLLLFCSWLIWLCTFCCAYH